ncbi:uncharacterized protein ANIA_11580 [Aspergillus nidulans FGSC A4]|uniref:Uncharacterized protein n=1 Tax=Emericella nidulans (strain FGSC A4 / ATCC 38163 / CBS 112.46 / NRRL 194 / M139) TaxID=227321 RepID=C8V3M4_EMENI|nr:hypothetical protein [Aspergillus nidulans FGSC A4]CBF73409.1 TPA: hypothetical protein ANIA_11580 [Aspergillus nidulans FGSC A4]
MARFCCLESEDAVPSGPFKLANGFRSHTEYRLSGR